MVVFGVWGFKANNKIIKEKGRKRWKNEKIGGLEGYENGWRFCCKYL